MADLATLISPVIKVPASGASQAFTANRPEGVDPWYDVTLTAACALSFSATAIAAEQTITVVLRQDSTAGRLASLPVIAWPNGTQPTLNTRAGFFDVLQFTTLDGGATWFGAALALAVQTPTLPGAPTIFVTPGSKSNAITILDGPAGGAAITSRNLYRGTAAGGETLVGAVALTGGVYTDTGLTNGTAYYYQATDVNAVGEGAKSAEKSATPYGYLNVPAGAATAATGSVPSGAPAGTTAARGATTFADVRMQVALGSLPSSGTAVLFCTNSTASSGYGCFVNSTGTIGIYNINSGSKFPAVSSTLPGSVLGQPAWLRYVLNGTGAAVSPPSGGTFAANTISYFYSLDGVTWVAIGSPSMPSGIDTTAAGVPQIIQSGNQPASRVLKLVVTDAAGNIQFNPDFTAAATGATSVTDSAATPNTFTINSPSAIV